MDLQCYGHTIAIVAAIRSELEVVQNSLNLEDCMNSPLNQLATLNAELEDENSPANCAMAQSSYASSSRA